MKKIHKCSKHPHLVTPNQFLVVWLFSSFHYAVTIEQMIEVFKEHLIGINKEEFKNALDYFIENDYLTRSLDTGKYFTVD